MNDAVIVSAVRTAVGKAPNGTLRGTRPDELAAVVIAEALARAPGLDAGRDRRRDPRLRDAGGRAGPERRAHREPARRHSGRARRRSPSTASARRACRRSRTPPSASCCGFAPAIVAGGTESMSLVPMGGHKVAPNPTLVDTLPGRLPDAPGSSPRTTRASRASRARSRTRSRCAATSARSRRSTPAGSPTRSCRSRRRGRRRRERRTAGRARA